MAVTDPELLRQLNEPRMNGPVVQPERLGPGPHTLVITDRDAMTRIDYRTGPDCKKARDEVRRQVAPPPNTATVIYGPPTTKAFCVPR